MKKLDIAPYRLIASLAGLSTVSVLLLLGRVFASDSTRYFFLIWNLGLAIIPPLLAWGLVRRVKKYGWLQWQQMGLSVLWLMFLPNSFYLITDYLHLRATYEASLLFDVIMITSFVVNGLILGYISVFLVHRELLRKVTPVQAHVFIGLVFLVCSFAVHLGRYSRWNTWDILLKPAGLLFDVSDQFINPAAHSETYVTTLALSMLIASLYFVIWEAAQLLRHH